MRQSNIPYARLFSFVIGRSPRQIAPSETREKLPGIRTTLLYIVRMIVYFYFIMLSTHWGHIALLLAAWSKLIGNVLVWLGGSHSTVVQSQVSGNMHYDRLLLCFVITLIIFDRDVARISTHDGLHRVEEEIDGTRRRLPLRSCDEELFLSCDDDTLQRKPLVIEVRNNSYDLDCFQWLHEDQCHAKSRNNVKNLLFVSS